MIYKNLAFGDLAVFHRPTINGKIWVLDADDGYCHIEVVNHDYIKRILTEAPF